MLLFTNTTPHPHPERFGQTSRFRIRERHRLSIVLEQTTMSPRMVFTLNNTRTLHFTSPSLWLRRRNSDARVLEHLEPLEATQKARQATL